MAISENLINCAFVCATRYNNLYNSEKPDELTECWNILSDFYFYIGDNIINGDLEIIDILDYLHKVNISSDELNNASEEKIKELSIYAMKTFIQITNKNK